MGPSSSRLICDEGREPRLIKARTKVAFNTRHTIIDRSEAELVVTDYWLTI